MGSTASFSPSCAPGAHVLCACGTAAAGGRQGFCHLQDAPGCLQEVLRLHGRVRVVGPGLPGLPLQLHRLAQRGEGLREATLLQVSDRM